ncbi:CU044_5270 family protein [Micromonospora sp. NPDC050200]|uniref:CU044_5270 family protein n=1 Tax=Micromonospora sp. NPDC050200 TaxID=3155664 RepID=UPI0033D5CA3C
MDDIQLIQELGQETPLPTSDRLAQARDRLASAMAAPPSTDVRTVRPARRRSTWRLAWTGFAATASAALAVAVYVLAPDQVGGEVPAANAEAAQVLHQAAAAALRVPDVEPRANQFVYVKSQSGGEIRQIWRSVDGTRDGLLLDQVGGRTEQIPLPGCRNGRRAVEKGGQVDPTRTEPCVPEPAYIQDLPTDADALSAYLTAHSGAAPGDTNALGKYILTLVDESYLRPNARAALFDVVAGMPNLTVVENATDGSGRPGIGIGWSSDGKSGQLVFDANTHAFLGMPESAILTVDIVDRVGTQN